MSMPIRSTITKYLKSPWTAILLPVVTVETIAFPSQIAEYGTTQAASDKLILVQDRVLPARDRLAGRHEPIDVVKFATLRALLSLSCDRGTVSSMAIPAIRE
jgi:hypothetical protein